MLTYHPAFDLSHCIFRILKILKYTKWSEIEVDRLKIWDFYFLFPSEISNHIKFPSEFLYKKQAFKDNSNPYEHLSDAKKIFIRMQPYQEVAFKNLASYGILDPIELENRIVKIDLDKIPSKLYERLQDVNDKDKSALTLLSKNFGNMPLSGREGFKMRTGLIDFKYDK
jgi:hypothetical protein